MHGRDALVKRSSRRRDERDFALEMGEFAGFLDLMVLKMAVGMRDFMPPL